MNELEQRMIIVEEKVKALEETLEALKNMQLSEQMKGYIQAKTKAVHMIDLLNTVSDEPSVDFDAERRNLENMHAEKASVDTQIANALAKNSRFSEDYPNDLRYFNYEIENGTKCGYSAPILSQFVGKGIRITAYNGFGSEQVIIVPKEIDGYPVVSIGEKAFMGVAASQIILPSSLKVIMNRAFSGCENLTQIDLPNGLAYLGDQCFRDCKKLTQVDLPNALFHLGSSCFKDTGLTSINIQNYVSMVSDSCFKDCKNLEKIVIGNQVKEISYWAFAGCSKLKQLLLPNGIKEISWEAFKGTSIRTMIFPESMEKLSGDVFADRYSAPGIKITCVFLGIDTMVKSRSFYGVDLIYCLPGSKVQSYARKHDIAIKPLSEFKMENYT